MNSFQKIKPAEAGIHPENILLRIHCAIYVWSAVMKKNYPIATN